MAGSWLMISSLALLTFLAYLAGVYLLWMPRQCAVICEVFAASGNLPSLIPRSVRAAIFEMRLIGSVLLVGALVLIHRALTPHWTRLFSAASADIRNPSWLVLPALLAILAGYTVATECAVYVARILVIWIDHPMVPSGFIAAFPWAMRLIGAALVLFGAGVFWFWLFVATG